MNFPILSAIIFIPLIGALFIFVTKGVQKNVEKNSKYVAIFSSLTNFLLSIFLWYSFDTTTADFQFVEKKNWIEGFINFQLGVDGISILFILLTTFIAPVCIFSAIHSIKFKIKEFLIAILVMETLMLGVFCSLDLVIFYLFFEGGLIPMFLIIGIWGGPKRVYSAFKFFLFTLLGSVLMLVAIISIYWITGTSDVIKLLDIRIPTEYQYLLWLAFFSSFAVKLPMWPVHTWLPDAHVEAPTAGSVILAAILLKMAGYGFFAFFTRLISSCFRLFYSINFYVKHCGNNLHIFSGAYARRYEKVNCLLFCCAYGFCNIGYFFTNQTRIRRKYNSNDKSRLNIRGTLFMCRCCIR